MTSHAALQQSNTDKLLYAAMEIIAKEGLRGLSASKLAKAVGISKSTVFHYYKSMEEIPSQVLEKLYSEILQPIQEVEYDSCYAYLSALGKGSFAIDQQQLIIYKAFVSLFQASMHNQQLQAIVNNCSQRFSAIIYEGLKCFSSPAVDDHSLHLLSQLILKTLDGIGLHYLINLNQQEAEAAWSSFIEAIMRQYKLNKEEML